VSERRGEERQEERDDRKIIPLLEELVILQARQVKLLEAIHKSHQSVYPATRGGSIKVS
jgi:hypothetical protein